MDNRTEPPLRDVAILTRAVEKVFRKLVRLLLGRMSLKKLQEILQSIFVEESEAKLRRENPGRSVSLSKLAILTGIDTRTINKIKADDTYLKPFYSEERFLRQITPECSLLDVWESSSKYTDAATGKPRSLKIKDAEDSFEALVYDAVSTRGVTAKSFLQRLKANKTVIVDEEKKEVRMIDDAYTPFDNKDQIATVSVGLAAVCNLVETIIHNVDAPSREEATFYQRGCWTHRLRLTDKEELRTIVTRFLKKQDQNAREILRPFEQSSFEHDQLTAGMSFFYFEDEIPE
jgi:hypothetical protein